MALSPITPRDRLQNLVDLGRKTLRYWWLVAVFAVVGGGLSLAFALTRPRLYQSWSVLFYQERIQSQLLSNSREEVAQRNIGDRFRELLLARSQLDQIIGDSKLDPYPDEHDLDAKIEKLRLAVRFESRGANAFRITFTDTDKARATAVTNRLTQLLQERDESLRNEQAAATVKFVTDQKEAASAELKKREQTLNEFLSKHPEFVADANNAQNEGALLRANRTPKAAVGNSRLVALDRQRQRIQQRLDAPPDAAPISIPTPATPERIAAEAQVAEAQRELNAANREVQDALSKYTPIHPATMKAQEHVAAATERLRQAKAAVPPEVETVVRPATAEDRAKLQKELQALDAQIAAEQSKSGKPTETADSAANWVVQLETQHADLRRAVNEQRETVQSLADSAFRAKIDADRKLAEQGGRLSVIDPASRPVQPTGPGKTIFLMAGMILFLSLGLSLAVGLAVIDDRLYRRVDLDQLGIPVLAVIPTAIPVDRGRRARRRKKRAASNKPLADGDQA
jgi:succinoglycan biosynthesis transport protein ExoP